MNPNVKYGFGVVTLCRRGVINRNKCPTLMGGVGNGGGYERVRLGGQGEIPVPASQICCESTCKTALKKQALKKKVLRS